jgi:Na+/H+-dicarboxylate symporter
LKKNSSDFLKYSGLAFQMLVLIAAGVGLGQWADEQWNTSSPVFTLVFGLLSVFLAIGLVLKDFIQKK